MTLNTSLPTSLLRQAAEWLVQLDHQRDPATRQAFEAWLAADPRHVAAIARLQGHLEPLRQLPAQSGGAALRQAARPGSGARALKLLALAALMVAAAVPVVQYKQQGYLFADLHTATGEWRNEALADASALVLEGRSAVDVQFDAQQRVLNLLHGAILVDVAKDPQRPFYVRTPQGSIRALGTRFTVERLGDATQVTMLESTTRIDSAGRSLTLKAGQQVRFDANGPQEVKNIDSQAVQKAWDEDQLIANDQPLAEVLERLGRYRPGLMLFDKDSLAALRVTVMLPTDDSERALRLLARTLPIEVRQYTPWVTRVSLKTPMKPR